MSYIALQLNVKLGTKLTRWMISFSTLKKPIPNALTQLNVEWRSLCPQHSMNKKVNC